MGISHIDGSLDEKLRGEQTGIHKQFSIIEHKHLIWQKTKSLKDSIKDQKKKVYPGPPRARHLSRQMQYDTYTNLHL